MYTRTRKPVSGSGGEQNICVHDDGCPLARRTTFYVLHTVVYHVTLRVLLLYILRTRYFTYGTTVYRYMYVLQHSPRVDKLYCSVELIS